LHFREARRKQAAKKQINDLIATLEPCPRIIAGKSVINLVPPSATLKGSALLDLIQKSGAKHVFYIGDDETDEDIFRLSYTRGQLMTVRVGQKESSRAKFFIQRQNEINRLLSYLIDFHKPTKSK
jgi:trehalose 6-phosphate phosphatase